MGFEQTDQSAPIPRSRLGREITIALSIKLVLLTGLWFWIFRGDDLERRKPPETADLFAGAPTPSAESSVPLPASTAANSHHEKEARNDR